MWTVTCSRVTKFMKGNVTGKRADWRLKIENGMEETAVSRYTQFLISHTKWRAYEAYYRYF
jgi:hypothetical protein